jgi:hypothetical protein
MRDDDTTFYKIFSKEKKTQKTNCLISLFNLDTGEGFTEAKFRKY